MTPSISREEIQIPGAPEPAYLVTPTGPSAGAVLFLHWFDEAPNANRSQFLEEASDLARLGVTSLLPQLSFPWRSPPELAARDIERIEAEVEALGRGISFLTDRTGVDRIAVVGHDFGAMYGCLLLGSIPATCGVLIAATPRWADWFLRFWPISGDRFDYLRALDPLDPINAVREVSVPLLFQFAAHDFYIAPMTGTELYEAAGGPKRIESYESGHELDVDEATQDRTDFLVEQLGLTGQ